MTVCFRTSNPKIRDVKKMKLAVVVIALASAAHALRPTMDRRAMLGAVSSGVVVGTAQAASAAAVKPCTAGANNCWSTASTDKNAMKPWAFPKGAKKSDAISQLQEVVGAYPQAGQADVDKGGWTYAVDSLASDGYARLEFKSGIGNFAKFFNGGKPFVDDLEFSVGDSAVGVRSSSRVGDSDFDVNKKRLNYIAQGLRAKGWDAPGV